MPRGKYPRQSAAVKAAIAGTLPTSARVLPTAQSVVAQVEQQEDAIDPALLADADQVFQKAAEVADVAITNARRPHRFADHAKSRDIDSLTHDQLRVYGREIGMSRRDCDDLTLDRLRAGCRAHLGRHFDELTE